ncbi:hypothetical protein F5B18DRAFT_644050 [Nemania serpens]|nr:hypothetical protein F5B18DRAFT_644050 [Nemania serpens]
MDCCLLGRTCWCVVDLEDTEPSHSQEDERSLRAKYSFNLKHNWSIVNQRQRDSSSRILAKLARTSNETKSEKAPFNVRSITEARKSRILNKYLTVFTVVTILFLPPTFVAVSCQSRLIVTN